MLKYYKITTQLKQGINNMETTFKYSLINLQELHLIEQPEMLFEDYVKQTITGLVGECQIIYEGNFIIAKII
jgi:hypothetical protein